MELQELLYKKYTGYDTPADYVRWAEEIIYLDMDEVKMLASMRPPLQPFEINEMFEKAVRAIGWELPSERDCALFHINLLHQHLLFNSDEVFANVKEIYNCSIQYDLEEKQLQWHEPSEWVDQFQYDKAFVLSKEEVIEKIIAYARELWYSEKSKYTFSTLLGQRILDVDVQAAPRFIVQFENGRLMIECAWRIRNTETILFGHADMDVNGMSWKDLQDLLINKTIQDVQLWENCPFLMVQLDDLFIDVFHSSTLFEGWSITEDGDHYLLSDHGGQIY
ncbi:hypothetical protein [Sporosarcina newyorkensis]|uniref:Uncharacterized protein n=1 Tax=Sporosarcina newyorkensis TaxID=759851 RepID=A0A1T4XSZ1_9BACL|nr:hypothetical protein [Sporosarcina newyorkensis]SKA92660.1 hypothetical protein SAMN04244570_1335 [Sporosarcina newyorkensis]